MSARSKFPYKKLPGSLRGFIRRASLWEGSDHLLSVSGTRFSEDYRRFYYRDIEAIIIQRCPRAGSIGLYVVGALVCLIGGVVAATSRAPLLWAIPAAFFAFLLARALLSFRYSCRCFVQTAVSREELPSLFRTWAATKALERVRNRIAEAQGFLPEDIGSLREAAATRNVPPPPVSQPESLVASAASGQTSALFGVNFAIATFVLLLIDATVSFWFLDAPATTLDSAWFRVFTVLLVVSEGVTLVLALIGIYKIKALRRLRNLLLANLGFLGVEVWLSLYFREIYNSERAVLHNIPSFQEIWHWVQLTGGSLALVLGVGGLILVLLNWQTYRRGDLLTA